MTTYEDIRAMDKSDPLACHRQLFSLPPQVVYLDGNSLGALPRATQRRMQDVIGQEWGQDLIKSWNTADWINLPQRVGSRIACLIGAEKDEVIATDSTSINLFRMVAGACRINAKEGRTRIVSEENNFPADLYILEGLTDTLGQGVQLDIVKTEDILDNLKDDVAVLTLTHVNYRTSAMHDMNAITKAAHDKGILVVWDLSHSAGAVPVDLNGAKADFAVGCGYKYLNGGPGAPAFLFVAKRHQNRVKPVLSGWMGHARPFDFDVSYDPAPGIRRHLAGTPGILGLSALEESLKVFENIDMQQIRRKSMALTQLFIDLLGEKCGSGTFMLSCPGKAEERGSQVTLRHSDGYAIIQALIGAGVVGDFRAPDVLRFGFAPLYLSYADIWRAVEALTVIMRDEVYKQPRYRKRNAVT